MNKNNTVLRSVVIRGQYTGNERENNLTYIPNGPPMQYAMRLGASVASVGDIDGDGIQDLAVGSMSSDSGTDRVYIMFLRRNGIVRNFTILGDRTGGGPELSGPFTNFGSSVLGMGDFDRDGVPDLVIGAEYYDDGVDLNSRSGALFFCFLRRDGTIKLSRKLSIWSEQKSGTADINCTTYFFLLT